MAFGKYLPAVEEVTDGLVEARGIIEHREVAGVGKHHDFAVRGVLLEDFRLVGVNNEVFVAVDAEGWHFDLAHARAEIGCPQGGDTFEERPHRQLG